MPGRSASLIPPSYAGVAFLLSWIYLLFYANTAGIEAAAPVSLMSAGYLISAAFMVISLLVVAFAPVNRRALLTNIVSKIVVALAMALSSLLLILGGGADNLPLTCVGGALTGIFSGFMAQQWVLVYKRITLKNIVCSFPTLMAVAVCTCMTAMYLPHEAMLALIALLPIVSELMFHYARFDLPPLDEIEVGPGNHPVNFLLLLMPVGICYLASGFLDFFSNVSSYTFVFYSLAAFVPLAVAAVFIVITNRRGITVSLIIPLCCLVMMAVPILSLYSYMPTAQFISIGELGLEVVIFVAVVAFSEFFNLGSLKVYALARTTMTVLNSIGWYLADYVNGHYSSLINSQASLLVVFLGVEVLSICLVVAIVKAQKDVMASTPEEEDESTTGPTPIAEAAATIAVKAAISSIDDDCPKTEAEQPAAPAASGTDAEARFAEACAQIARRHDLSRREVDVFVLLARGYSASRIQKELYIAAGTVNYHTRNIYSKLGVHSKQEVIDLMNEQLQK